jgi:uncharacterized protein (DUF2164 family)
MSGRQKIEDALKATPNISLDELQSQLPDIKPVTLKSDYYKLKRKLFGPVKNKKPKATLQKKTRAKSNRQKVHDYLNKNTETSFDTLQSEFPDVKPATLRNYLSESKKANKLDTAKAKSAKKPVKAKSEPAKKKTKKKSVRQQVSDYLDKNTETSFNTLQTAFPDIKKTSLSVYLSQWRKEQPKKEDIPVKKTNLDKVAKQAKPAKDKPVKEKMPDKTVKPSKSVKKSDTDLIQSLKETIAAQEKTIKTMNRSIELLSPESDVEELKGMTLFEIKRIAAVYLKSIKELPTKFRR